MNRSDYYIERLSPGFVFLVDMNQGGRSVTNDAENVVREVNSHHPDCRIIYRDSDGIRDELIHENGVFKGFAAYEQ